MVIGHLLFDGDDFNRLKEKANRKKVVVKVQEVES